MKITRENFLKKGISLICILTLVMSLVVVSSLGSQAANSQSDEGCTKLPIANVSASKETSNSKAQFVIDNDPTTRWRQQLEGAYVILDLGQPTDICSLDILWFDGQRLSYNFVVEISDDGEKWSKVLSGESTGNTNSAERYNTPDIRAKFLSVTINGNDEDDLGSIAEMQVNGLRNNGICEIPQITKVNAIGDDGNEPQNTLDTNLDTRWSNLGFPSWIQYDLGESQPVCNVDIAWWRGNFRVNTFTVSVSNDGINFTPVFSGQNSGQTIGLERYDVQDTMSRYVRITVTGNTENRWSSISEVRLNGGAIMECKAPQISGVRARGDDGNEPQNTLDSNLDTRWSNLGFPSWIQYDLGESQPVCNVDIAWWRGNFRVNTFTVSVSNDGTNFTPVFSGQNSGQTIGLERYDVQDTMSRYVRITVTGNNENRWSSISEVRINGGATPTPTPDPTPTPTPDPTPTPTPDPTPTPTPDPTPTPTPGTDPFGIKKIYPTKSGGEEWFMDMSDGQDPRSNPPSLSKNSDGSFKVTSTQVRYGAFTSAGYDPDKIETLDHSRIAEKGYMQSPNDWRDVEMTGYVKVNDGDSDENFAWYARGGRHTGSGSPEGCEGVAYKPDLFYDGRVRFAKEQWHVSYAFTDHKNAMGSIEGEWVGFKGIMYNIEENGETAVKMEIWLDKNNDGNWEKVDENIDRGGWGDNGEECGGASDQIITWGGPIATFRWDGATDVDIKNFSVREIQPLS